MAKKVMYKIGGFLAGALTVLVVLGVALATLGLPGVFKLYTQVDSSPFLGPEALSEDGEHSYIVAETYAWIEDWGPQADAKVMYAVSYRGLFIVSVGIRPLPQAEPQYWTLVWAYDAGHWHYIDAWHDLR